MSQNPTPVETGKSHQGATERPTEAAPRILLVEDDDAVRLVVTRVLKRLGFDIVEAQNGSEAVALCDMLGYGLALVIADIVMPEMGGVRLAEHLAGRTPPLPVVLMSGHSADASCLDGAASVAAAFLEKPFTPEALATVVREVLRPDRAREAAS